MAIAYTDYLDQLGGRLAQITGDFDGDGHDDLGLGLMTVDETGAMSFQPLAVIPSYGGEVRVATGDVTGDGVADVVVALNGGDGFVFTTDEQGFVIADAVRIERLTISDDLTINGPGGEGEETLSLDAEGAAPSEGVLQFGGGLYNLGGYSFEDRSGEEEIYVVSGGTYGSDFYADGAPEDPIIFSEAGADETSYVGETAEGHDWYIGEASDGNDWFTATGDLWL